MNVMDGLSTNCDRTLAAAMAKAQQSMKQTGNLTALGPIPTVARTQCNAPVNSFNIQNANMKYWSLLHQMQGHPRLSSGVRDDLLLRGLMMSNGDSSLMHQFDANDFMAKRRQLVEYQMRMDMMTKVRSMNDQALAALATLGTVAPFPPGLVLSDTSAAMSSENDSGCDESPTKRARTEKSVNYDNARAVIEPIGHLSSFPLPASRQSRKDHDDDDAKSKTIPIGKLTSFRKTWARLERCSDRMDDTIADQESFVREFFQRSFHSRSNDHLKRKLRDAILPGFS